MSESRAYLVIVRGYVVTDCGDPSYWDTDAIMQDIHGISCTVEEVHPKVTRPEVTILERLELLSDCIDWASRRAPGTRKDRPNCTVRFPTRLLERLAELSASDDLAEE